MRSRVSLLLLAASLLGCPAPREKTEVADTHEGVPARPKSRKEAEHTLVILVTSPKVQVAPLKKSCTGAPSGATDFQCDPRNPDFMAHVAQIKNLGLLVDSVMRTDFKFEAKFLHPGDLALEVSLDVTGLVDGIPYPTAPPALRRQFNALIAQYHGNAADWTTGNRMLCFTRAGIAASSIRGSVRDALTAVTTPVVEKPVVITCEEQSMVGGEFRGVRYVSMVILRLPNYEIAASLKGRIPVDPDIGAARVEFLENDDEAEPATRPEHD